jgi:uncharacterized metal-binding protein YceD (DUF177 family)
MTIKMVEDPELMNGQEDDPDMYYISQGDSHIDVANWIYEFISLSLPMQKTCEFETMDGPYCNGAALELLKKMEPEENKIKETRSGKDWRSLKTWNESLAGSQRTDF